MYQFSQVFFDILTCPYCSVNVELANNNYSCKSCHTIFNKIDGQLDMRIHKTKDVSLNFEINNTVPNNSNIRLLSYGSNTSYKIKNKKIYKHISKKLLSHLPKAKSESSLALDIGCGKRIHEEVCTVAGYKYLGTDIISPNAHILSDAHALPFKDNSFELIISMAVLEHIKFPFVMIKEVYRVLKPGGTFIGSVAFLEAFHSNSFYHHSHMGLINTLQYGGFHQLKIAPSTQWNVIVAISKSLFPLLPKAFSKIIVLPLNLLHITYWKIGHFFSKNNKYSRLQRLIKMGGSFQFICNK